ncbi:hypothetical protein T440DRAFT_315345 [Plenodomus tracheiphilus IPT5]|uniref:Uncharacterized protein n=1 Tax=Plenodomus tracheiphilus IPT5 TaxID=1408161 RepID=A0A6A7AMZ0_9PLEO|nr:hypothetical protein T440DRAFT_315345 [Plenodomus tracheiphilus IPT5]
MTLESASSRQVQQHLGTCLQANRIGVRRGDTSHPPTCVTPSCSHRFPVSSRWPLTLLRFSSHASFVSFLIYQSHLPTSTLRVTFNHPFHVFVIPFIAFCATVLLSLSYLVFSFVGHVSRRFRYTSDKS